MQEITMTGLKNNSDLFFCVYDYLSVGQVHHNYTVFRILKRQVMSTDTSFDTKMMVKSGAIEIIFKSHEPFQSYLLTSQANSAKKAG